MIRYPKLNRNAQRNVLIPSLDGGINTLNGATHILDTQLCDALNVWFNDGTLKTRPKITQKSDEKLGGFGHYLIIDEYEKTRTAEYVYKIKSEDEGLNSGTVYGFTKWGDKQISLKTNGNLGFNLSINGYLRLKDNKLIGFDVKGAGNEYIYIGEKELVSIGGDSYTDLALYGDFEYISDKTREIIAIRQTNIPIGTELFAHQSLDVFACGKDNANFILMSSKAIYANDSHTGYSVSFYTNSCDTAEGKMIFVKAVGTNYERYIIYLVKNNRDIELKYDYIDNNGTISLTDNLYKPTLLINGKGDNYSNLPITTSTEYAPASTYEGLNLLPSAFKMYFMTDCISRSFTFPVPVDVKGLKIEVLIDTDKNIVKQGNKTTIASVNSHLSEYSTVDDVISACFGNTLYTEQKLVFDEFKNDHTFTTTNRYTSRYIYKIDYTDGYEYYSKDSVDEWVKENNNVNGCYGCELIIANGMAIGFILYGGFGWSVNGETSQIECRKLEYYHCDKKPCFDFTITNNIEVTAYRKTDALQNFDDIFLEAKLSEVYGGGEGIFGGTRTFISKDNYLYFTTASHYDYFGENLFFAVGGDDEITALKKLGDILVIFKNNSVYYTKTAYNEQATAEQVQNGNIVDVATNNVYFPIYQIHDSIGCDLPNTVIMALNRLIFANKKGDVYTIVTTSNESGRNIYKLSTQIQNKFFDSNGKSLLNENAFALDYNEHYLLFCDGKVWALNYNKDSYRYVYSFTYKTNNSSNRDFTWWYWETDLFTSGAVIDGTMKLFNNREVTETSGMYDTYFKCACYIADNLEADDNCKSMISTKIFDLGRPNLFKSITKLHIGVGNDIGANVTVTINTDKGDVYRRPFVVEQNDSGTKYNAQYGATMRLIPYCHKIKRFGIRLDCNGVISVEDMEFWYKMLSEVF